MTFVASQHYLTQTEAPAPRTLVEKAYRAMRADIIEGRLPPGYKLRVEHLKEDYDVGAGTLREALSLLVSDALVYAEGQRGFRVSPISLVDLEALRQSIRHGDARWEAELRDSYDAMTRLRDSSGHIDTQQFEQCNKRFHEALIAGYHSPWTKYLLGLLNRHSERYRYMTLQLVAEHTVERNVDEEHEIIFRAAIARQDARAALALETHVRTTCDLIRQVARSQALPGFEDAKSQLLARE